MDKIEITELIVRGKPDRVKNANTELLKFIDTLDKKFKVKIAWVEK